MECYFKHEEDKYIIGNDYIEKTLKYNGSNLQTESVIDKKNHFTWVQKQGKYTEFFYEGLTGFTKNEIENFKFDLLDVKVNTITQSIYSKPYLDLVFYMAESLRKVYIIRHYIVYEGVGAIKSYIEVKSDNIPFGDFFEKKRFNVLDTFTLPCNEGKLRSFEFFTRTDKTNHLVEEVNDPKEFDKGNVIIYQGNAGNGIILLKESPCFSDQRPEADGNFFIENDKIQMVGWGIRPEEISSTEYKTSYSSVIGVYYGGYEHSISALKNYQSAIAILKPERDYMVMANPWGEGNLYQHMSEKFVLDEVEAAQKLGATHYQLDDGWESGNLIELLANKYTNESFWNINNELFPNGFDTIVEKAKECGIEFTLWFLPSFERLYRNHSEQAETLFNMYKKYGIKTFKIDGMNIRNKECEDNIEKLFDELKHRSNGEITFNLDTTANARPGYFMFHQYGNVFLENRYILEHIVNYYPHITLKNLWELSCFIPTQKLQIEFLNIDRQSDLLNPDDVLSPCNYSYEYVVAITMFANPLCWFAPSRLKSETLQRYRKMLELHKKYRNEIFEGQIFPIGQRPNGYSWTGFQSHNSCSKTGFVIVYRENSPRQKYFIKPYFLEGNGIKLESLSDNTCDIQVSNYNGNGIEIELKDVNSFRLYKYITY